MTIKDLFTHRVLTVSNFLSFSRIVLLVPLWYLVWNESYINEYKFETLTIALVMIATDFFDGFLARKLGQETPLGQYLDPVADKVTILGGLFLLYLTRGYPLWLFLYILARELGGTVLGMFLLTKRNIMGKPNFWGKSGVFFISLSSIWYLLDLPFKRLTDIPVVFVLTGGILAYSSKYVKTVFNQES